MVNTKTLSNTNWRRWLPLLLLAAWLGNGPKAGPDFPGVPWTITETADNLTPANSLDLAPVLRLAGVHHVFQGRAVAMNDFDGDGVPDDDDVDDDNDGILDIDECELTNLDQIGFEDGVSVDPALTQAAPLNNFKSNYDFAGSGVNVYTASPDYVADMTDSPWYPVGEGASYAALQAGITTPPHDGGDGLFFSISAAELAAAGASNGDQITVSFLYLPGINYKLGISGVGRAADAGTQLKLYYGNGSFDGVSDNNNITQVDGHVTNNPLPLSTATATDQVTLNAWQNGGDFDSGEPNGNRPITIPNTFSVYNGSFVWTGGDAYFFVICVAAATQSNGYYQGGDYVYFDDLKLAVNNNCANTDNSDGVNSQDTDADGDGCADAIEAGHSDPDNNGFLGTGTPTLANGGVDANGRVIGAGGYTGPAAAAVDPQDNSACCTLEITNVASTNEGCPDADDGTITVTAGGATNITYNLSQSGSVVATNSNGTFTGLADGTYDVSVDDTDNAGCTATAASSVTIAAGSDGNAPDVPTLTTINEQCAYDLAPANYPTTTDDCDGTVTGTTVTEFPITAQGTTTITWTFTDAAGNSSSATQTVNINDTTDPELQDCPTGPIDLDTDAGTCIATLPDYTASITATDNCGGASEPSGQVYNIPADGSTTTVADCTGTLLDGGGTNDYGDNDLGFFTIDVDGSDPIVLSFVSINTELGHDIVRVYDGPDSNAPFIAFFSGTSTPGDVASTGSAITIEFDTDGSVTGPGFELNWTSGSCGGPTVTQTPAAGTLLAPGTHTVTITAEDAVGNTEDCSFDVNVTDNEAPVANCADDFTVSIDANGEAVITTAMLDNAVTPSSDNCDGLVLSIDSNTPATFNCNAVGAGPQTVTLVASDGSLSSSCNVQVTVNDADANCCAITLDNIVSTREVCGDDGTLTVAATCASCDNGNSDIEYSINGLDFQSSNVFDQLSDGSYTVTIRDANNTTCTATLATTVGDCVGEIPGNGNDDDCDGDTDDDAGSVTWILLDNGDANGGCASTTDLCGQVVCFGLEYSPNVSGTLTSYTTGFTSAYCNAGATPIISNGSCVMTDNSFDAQDCAGGNGIFWNSSGFNGTLELTKDQPVILHQLCLNIADDQSMVIVEDVITDITMSVEVPAVILGDPAIQATDRPDFNGGSLTVAGNQSPTFTATGIDACYETVAAAEAAALAAVTPDDDFTAVANLIVTVATVGDCAATVTVSIEDECGLITDVPFSTRIDGDAPVIAETLAPIEQEGCSIAEVPAATTVAGLEALGVANFDISDNCSADADLVVTSSDVVGTDCPIVVTRTYTITDECGRFSTVDQTITLTDVTAPLVSGSIDMITVNGCEESDAPAAATSVAELEALDGDLGITDNCTAPLTVSVQSEVINNACPRVLTRVYNITDACGNVSSVTQQITIQDLLAPTATGSLNLVTLEGCDAAALPDPATSVVQLEALDGDLDLSDNCTDDADLTVSSNDVMDTNVACPLKVTVTRTYTIADRCGNSFDVVQTFNVQDITAPVVTGNLTTASVEGCDASAAPAAATDVAELLALAGDLAIADACTDNADLSVSHSDASAAGTCPNVLVITRTYTVADDCNNPTSFTQTINITDNTAPSVTGTATEITVEGCTANDAPAAADNVADLLLLGANLLISDACTDAAQLLVTHSDASAGSCPVVVTRTYSIADACGNASTLTHVINVLDDTDPTVTKDVANLAACYVDAAAAQSAAEAAVSATDNCAGDVTISSAVTGSCPSTITVTGTDACGNTASVSFQTVITNGTAPAEVGGPVATNATIQSTLDDLEPTELPVIQDVCGNVLTPSPAVIGGTYQEGMCTGTITYTYSYVDCAGTDFDWVFTYNVDCQGLKLKVFLEGNMDVVNNVVSLSDELNTGGRLPGMTNLFPFNTTDTPFGHPYSGAPWNYANYDGAVYGDAARADAPAGTKAYPAHVVDWVLVSIRENGINLSNEVWSCVGWLHTNGEVTFPDNCPLTLDVNSTYHVVIEHRNHLPVMDEAMINGGGTYLSLDFTSGDSYAPIFRVGQIEINGVWAMFAGNTEQSGSRISINSADLTRWRTEQGSNDYGSGDINLNGFTNSADETSWKNNQNRTSGINFNN